MKNGFGYIGRTAARASVWNWAHYNCNQARKPNQLMPRAEAATLRFVGKSVLVMGTFILAAAATGSGAVGLIVAGFATFKFVSKKDKR